MNHAKGHYWVLDFLLLSAIWGASFLFTRHAVVEFGTWATAALRVGIAAAVLLPILVWRGQLNWLRSHGRQLLVLGLFSSAIPFACFAFALLSISTGLSSILNATTPLSGALIAWIWLKDRPDWLRALGLAIGFAGVVLLASGKASFKPDATGVVTGWAVLACLLATLCYGISASYARRHLVGVPPLVMTAGSQGAATVFLVGPALWAWPEATPGWQAWGAIAVVGVLCTAVAYLLYFRLIDRRGPTSGLTVTFVVPVFALFYGWALLDETVTAWMIACCAIIAAGTALSTGLIKRRASG